MTTCLQCGSEEALALLTSVECPVCDGPDTEVEEYPDYTGDDVLAEAFRRAREEQQATLEFFGEVARQVSGMDLPHCPEFLHADVHVVLPGSINTMPISVRFADPDDESEGE